MTKQRHVPHRHAHVPPAYVTLFINSNKEAAQKVAKKYNIPASVILAQSALESSWGREAPDNMYFGIKGTAPDGASVNVTTHEETSAGAKMQIEGKFRAYASYADAADDYGNLITTNKAYAGALLHRDNPGEFVDALAKRYATDHKYASKLKVIIKTNHLEQYDANSK